MTDRIVKLCEKINQSIEKLALLHVQSNVVEPLKNPGELASAVGDDPMKVIKRLNGIKEFVKVYKPANHRTVFSAKLDGKEVLLKIFSETTYHSWNVSKLEKFSDEFQLLTEMAELGIAVEVMGLYEMEFSEFKSKLEDGNKVKKEELEECEFLYADRDLY